MTDHIETTRRQIGELAAMANQTEAMERQILSRAQKLLADIDGELDRVRADAMAGDDGAKQRYMDMVKERGHLQQVIAQANSVLAQQ